LITVSSKHGSTGEIAGAIAAELTAAGHAADVGNAADVESVSGYDAAVIGSAIYMGNWLPEARHFVERTAAGLSGIPVWLFSSGPLGSDHPLPEGDPAKLDELMAETKARGHMTFVGKLDRSRLAMGERLVTRMVKAPEGDFRDWDAIRIWAQSIARTLDAEAAVRH
jgi:menaquinone-dependent protoporphyrinogen oxidase